MGSCVCEETIWQQETILFCLVVLILEYAHHEPLGNSLWASSLRYHLAISYEISSCKSRIDVICIHFTLTYECIITKYKYIMPLMVYPLLEHVTQISQANCPARRPANIHETLQIEVMNGRCCKHNNKLVQTCSTCFSTHSHTSKQYVVDDCSMVDHGHLHPPINWSTNKKHARPIIHPWQSDCNGRMRTWQITWNQHETVSSVTFKAGHQLQIFRYSWLNASFWLIKEYRILITIKRAGVRIANITMSTIQSPQSYNIQWIVSIRGVQPLTWLVVMSLWSSMIYKHPTKWNRQRPLQVYKLA